MNKPPSHFSETPFRKKLRHFFSSKNQNRNISVHLRDTEQPAPSWDGHRAPEREALENWTAEWKSTEQKQCVLWSIS